MSGYVNTSDDETIGVVNSRTNGQIIILNIQEGDEQTFVTTLTAVAARELALLLVSAAETAEG